VNKLPVCGVLLVSYNDIAVELKPVGVHVLPP
jgi:hypothetical protein